MSDGLKEDRVKETVEELCDAGETDREEGRERERRQR